MSVRASKPALLEQLQSGHQVIEASAGPGKTFTLQRLVADLVLAGTPIERILVVTFTDKATQELLTRIRGYLQHLLEQRQDDGEGPFWEIDDAGRARLTTALRGFDRAPISTIHGFCRQILQESALEGRTLFDRELADERGLFGKAFRHALAHHFTQVPELCQILETSLVQGERVETLEDELWAIHSDGGEVLPPLATWRAWMGSLDMAWFAEVESLAGAWKTAKVHSSTIASARKALDSLAFALTKAESAFEFSQAFDAPGLASLWKATAKLAEAPGDPGPLHAWLAQGEALLVSPQALRAQVLLGPVQETLRRLTQADGLFTFQGMIQGVVEALEAPEGEALAQRLRDRYDLALVDEFQDTDPLQWQIFKCIFLREDRRLILIGDPKQAIYGFRGGDLPTYRQACQELLQGREPLRLELNFRSTPQVIEAYNHILSGDGPASFFREPSLYPRPVGCGRPTCQTLCNGQPVKPVEVLVLDTLKGGQGLWRRLARQMAQRIQGTVASGLDFGEPGALRRLGYGDVQVLVGKTSEGELMAKALRAEGIPCAFYKQRGLFQTREAEAWLALLRAVAQPRDRTSQLRAFLSPFFAYDLEALRRLPAMPEGHPALQRLLAWGALAQTHRFGEMLDAMLEESGLVHRLLLCETGYRSLVNYRHIAEALLALSAKGSLTLHDLIRALDRWQRQLEKPPAEDGELQRLEGDRDAVQILTLHAAKGLEAPIVAVFAFGKPRASNLRRFHHQGKRALCLGNAPALFTEQAKQEAADEHERLLYVGMTRAQAKLILCAFDQRTQSQTLASLQCAYDALNKRLVDLRDTAETHFAWMHIPALGITPLAERAPQLPADVALPELPAPEKSWDYGNLSRRARPSFTTSFSSLQDRIAREEAPLRGDRDQPGLRPPPGELPKGTHSGQVLHELLEWADLATLDRLEVWSQRPEVRARVQETLEAHGIPRALESKVAEVVFRGLTSELPLAWGGSLCVATAEKVLREVDFLARFLAAERSPETKDLLKGSIDVLCEHQGRIYILDWKNSLLPDYTWASLQEAVDSHYRMQAQVYLQAVLAAFGIRDEADYEARFGGILYVFLRGLPTQGTWSIRPTWAEVQTWMDELARIHREVAIG